MMLSCWTVKVWMDFCFGRAETEMQRDTRAEGQRQSGRKRDKERGRKRCRGLSLPACHTHFPLGAWGCPARGAVHIFPCISKCCDIIQGRQSVRVQEQGHRAEKLGPPARPLRSLGPESYSRPSLLLPRSLPGLLNECFCTGSSLLSNGMSEV